MYIYQSCNRTDRCETNLFCFFQQQQIDAPITLEGGRDQSTPIDQRVRADRVHGRGVLRFRPLAPVPAAAQHSGVSGRLGAFPRVALTRNGPLRLPPTMQLGAWTALTHPGPAQGRPRQVVRRTEQAVAPHPTSRPKATVGAAAPAIELVRSTLFSLGPWALMQPAQGQVPQAQDPQVPLLPLQRVVRLVACDLEHLVQGLRAIAGQVGRAERNMETSVSVIALVKATTRSVSGGCLPGLFSAGRNGPAGQLAHRVSGRVPAWPPESGPADVGGRPR
ncbi:hypothetical protein PAPYR_9725 [Paratrimastix pyriformis]|uniref:Uncharacterized protein n=1 Tax=Paratrimastix pyriformis TaxID=342808 RepID=A0ABQ8U7L8_9EUKA|nr:hypothetical protein PAPYR_9725 [Paratrimastix pyriformis]